MFNKFVKSILKESGLQEDGFVHNNKHIFISPVDNFFKGYAFDKVHDHFYLNLFVVPVYSPVNHAPMTYGWRLCITPQKSAFRWHKEDDNTEVSAEIIQLLKGAKNFLLGIKSSLDFYNTFKDFDKKDKSVDIYHHRKTMAFTLCHMGHIDCCNVLDEALNKIQSSDRKHLPWMEEIAANLQKLKSVCLHQNEREKLFSEWRTHTLNNLRLGKYLLKPTL